MPEPSDPGSIHVGDMAGVTGAAIGPGAKAKVNITNNITRGLDELPTRYDGAVRNFLDYYLGSPDHPAPFGGRAADLDALDRWLIDSNAAPYALLVAPAGRGKSALLAHWLARLTERGEPVHVVFFPVSIRFNTNLATAVFSSLAARMAHLYGEKVTQANDAGQYRSVFIDYLRRPPPSSRVLVVLDGLDEAAGWEAGADIFPLYPSDHLRVLVAARPFAGDAGADGWARRLGWDRAGLVRPVPLERLDRAGVGDVLVQMGNPLDALAAHLDVVGKLYELSEGDPLLVRLYVEALTAQGDQAAVFTPVDLLKLQPGLAAYFDRWFKEQHRLWGDLNPVKEQARDTLLNLCAMALGALQRVDLWTLAPDIFKTGSILDDAESVVNRLVIGDGKTSASGYVFSHPRLGEYFAERMLPHERKMWREQFLRYGSESLARLDAKTLPPNEASRYIVQYYGAHLDCGRTPNGDVNVRYNGAYLDCNPAPDVDVYALVREGWLRAWEATEGTPAGFLNDVRRAWARAEQAGPAALGIQVRTLLCFSSVASVSANIKKELLVACLKYGVISPPLALVLARQKPDLHERASCLAAIAPLYPVTQSGEIVTEALAAVRGIQNESSRVLALSALVPHLPEGERAAVVTDALAAVRGIQNEYWRAIALRVLVPLLPDHLLGEAIQVARATSGDFGITPVFTNLAERWTAVCRATGSSEFEELSSTLHAFAAVQREQSLGAIAALLPIVEKLGGQQAVRETAQAILDTARWWP